MAAVSHSSARDRASAFSAVVSTSVRQASSRAEAARSRAAHPAVSGPKDSSAVSA
ncbi:hypothetical protein GCM10009677_04340 [Sphaerisporangium rubeum]